MVAGIIKKHPLYLILAWTVLVILSLAWNAYQGHKDTLNRALLEAKTYNELNLSYRQWASMIGGIYAPVDKVSPNPYLTVPDRDIMTTGGRRFTLINPAYMTRMVFEIVNSKSELPVKSKLTSLKNLNPVNVPDEWEKKALLSFEKGQKEASEVVTIGGMPYLRYIKAFITEESCLKCHLRQGYNVGDVRGGISFNVPLKPYYESEAASRRTIIVSHILLWVIVSFGILVFSRNLRRRQEEIAESERKNAEEKEKMILELREALDKIKTLRGLIPICASCKKIRDDKGYWNQIESYISKHSEAEFSHGICPDCRKKLYPDL